MNLIYYPDKRLSNTSKEIKYNNPIYSPDCRKELASLMCSIMNKYQGIGLSAPQVGLNIRMFVWRHYLKYLSIWNPVLDIANGYESGIEGCLSLPGVSVTKNRAKQSRLTGLGIDGKKISMWGDGFNTRIWQHEIDHLNGKLIIDDMDEQDEIKNRKAINKLIFKF